MSQLPTINEVAALSYMSEMRKIAYRQGVGYTGSNMSGPGFGSTAAMKPIAQAGAMGAGVRGYKKGGVVNKESVVRVAEDDTEEVILPKNKMRSKKDKKVYNYVRDKVR